MRGDIGSNLMSLGRLCLLVSLLTVPVISPTSANGDDSGQTLISAQSTGDNRADLAIAVPSDSIDSVAFAGAVNVLYSSSAGLSATNNQLWHQDSPDIEGGAETSDCFGKALAAGDFNRDGYVDLAVGVPREDVDSVAGAGVVNVLYGSFAGLSAAGDQLWSQDPSGVAGTAEAVDLFGSALTASDFDGDGYSDLAVGVPYEDVDSVADAGVVNVLYGSSAGLSAAGDQLWSQDPSGVAGAAEAFDFFGNALVALEPVQYRAYMPSILRQ